MDIFNLEKHGLYRHVDKLFKQANLDIYPMAGPMVDGLEVSDDVPNTSSIASTLNDYEILPGIREVPFSDFSGISGFFYAKNDWDHARYLSGQIGQNGQIKPLIVVIENDEPYILEGAHRFVALAQLGKTKFPALVVIDTSENSDEGLDSEPRSDIIGLPVGAQAPR